MLSSTHNVHICHISNPRQHLEDTHALKAQCQAMLDQLWSRFQEQTQNYRKATEERKMRFEALKKKDEESAHTIATQMSKIQRLQVQHSMKAPQWNL